MIAADASRRQIAWSFVPEAGSIYGFGRDVTEQRMAEDALRQSQKMEAVGQLTGGIAHDFNNLLQGITGNLDVVQRRIALGRTSGLERFIDGAVTSANRAAALTHRLLAFSRRQPLDPRPVEINPLVASTEDLLRRTLGERIELAFELSDGLWLTRCDPNQLESALLNLAINARDAMPDGGRLSIRTANLDVSRAMLTRQLDLRPGQYVAVSVTDTGTGMSAETAAKAFEPFFTTKPIGQGTGLGLSMIYGFARQSGGDTKIFSELGHGTTVLLYLPRYVGEPLPLSPEPRPVEMQGPDRLEHHTILLVEDEPVVRNVIAEVLSECGYRVLQSTDGLSGLHALETRSGIDLLITDIGLPGMNGRQLAERAVQLRPGLPVLLMTGYAEKAAVVADVVDPGMQLITKPIALDALVAKVRALFDAHLTT
jgi:signal transduction histidine kinase/CheY-like chemotaxis protein